MIVRCCLVLLFFAAATGAQGLIEKREVTVASIPYTPHSATVIKVDARLVEAPVVVRNGKGEAVAGLRREDFEIRDEGKKREITSFTVATTARSATRPAGNSDGGATAVPAAGAAKGRTRYVGLLFDDLNSGPAELISARLAAQRFLKEGIEPGDRVAVFTTYGRQILAFTTDAAQVSAALDKLAPHPMKSDYNLCPSMSPFEAYLITSRTDSDVLPVKVDETRRCSGQPPAPQRRGKQGGSAEASADPIVEQVLGLARNIWEQTMAVSRNTLGAIHDIVDYMAQYKGERLLVCASGGFLSGTLEREQDDLINRALHAGVTIDSLDAKGLYVQNAPQMGMGASVRSVIMQQNLGTRPQESANDALAVLAYGTGGLFFHNNNDLTAGLREMMAPEVTYLLGFAPGSADNKYHRLKVRVAAPGHFDVQARPGYMALATSPAPDSAPRKIDEAALATDARPDPSFSLGSTAGDAADGTKAFAAVLHLDLKRLSFREAFGIRNQRVIFVATLTDPQGNFVTGREYTIDFALKQDSFDKFSGGFNAAAVLQAPKGKYRLRGAADLGNGTIAAATLEVEIP